MSSLNGYEYSLCNIFMVLNDCFNIITKQHYYYHYKNIINKTSSLKHYYYYYYYYHCYSIIIKLLFNCFVHCPVKSFIIILLKKTTLSFLYQTRFAMLTLNLYWCCFTCTSFAYQQNRFVIIDQVYYVFNCIPVRLANRKSVTCKGMLFLTQR